jgi:phage repressor protein C with HTH and peptisase S24 domain
VGIYANGVSPEEELVLIDRFKTILTVSKNREQVRVNGDSMNDSFTEGSIIPDVGESSKDRLIVEGDLSKYELKRSFRVPSVEL